jgi:hypothetical protein
MHSVYLSFGQVSAKTKAKRAETNKVNFIVLIFILSKEYDMI